MSCGGFCLQNHPDFAGNRALDAPSIQPSPLLLHGAAFEQRLSDQREEDVACKVWAVKIHPALSSVLSGSYMRCVNFKKQGIKKPIAFQQPAFLSTIYNLN
jgi:hypothetical protein